MSRALVVVLFALFLPSTCFADGRLVSWGGSDLKGMTEQRFEAAARRNPGAILDLNARLESWPEVYEVLLGANEHRGSKKFLRQLAAQVSDSRITSLRDTSRLIIWERVSSGDLLFEGKGLQIDDDLFMLAGRANWILRTTTEKNFGVVKPHTTPADLEALRRSWEEYLDGGSPAEYESPNQSPEAGLEELRSLAAVEALIRSLRPSRAKHQLTLDCLRRSYGLEKLPEDPSEPARMCLPDTYAASYLARITDVEEAHEQDWWHEWWSKNENRLTWNPTTARFEVR